MCTHNYSFWDGSIRNSIQNLVIRVIVLIESTISFFYEKASYQTLTFWHKLLLIFLSITTQALSLVS